MTQPGTIATREAAAASPTARLAEFASELSYADLPPNVAHQAKRVIADTLACIVGAHPYPAAAVLQQVFESLGGTPESRALPSGFLTSAPQAAFVNGQLANLLDLDDNFHLRTHFANVSVVAPLAVAERVGASGAQLMQAVTVAFETSARLILSFPRETVLSGSWPDIDIRAAKTNGIGFTALGGAAGCGNVLGLSPSRMRNALGVAGYSAPVPSIQKALRSNLTMNKYASYGQASWNAVTAALLAEAGFTSDESVLDGDAGFWCMTGAAGSDEGVLTGGFGDEWWILDTGFKRDPVCGAAKYPARAARLLLAEHDIRPEDITQVDVYHAHYRIQTPLKEELAADEGRAPAPWFITDPEDHLEMQLSMPWAVAMVLLGVPGPQWQQPATLASPEARALARKVAIRLDPDALKVYWDQLKTPGICRLQRFPVTLAVTTRDGSRFEARTEIADGDPWDSSSALTDDDIRSKLIEFGQDFIARDRLERAADAVFALETVPDIRVVTELLTVSDRAAVARGRR